MRTHIMIMLYDYPLSGHAHRARLLLSLLKLEYVRKTINIRDGENRETAFLKLNPLGQVPVLVDEDVVLRDSTAILVYLASKYDPTRSWLPQDVVRAAQVQQWLTTSVKELAMGLAAARAVKVFNRDVDHAAAVEQSHALLKTLFEPHLENNDWLVGGKATIADIANYSYIAMADEGEVDLMTYPHTRAWLARVEGMDGFEIMPRALENK